MRMLLIVVLVLTSGSAGCGDQRDSSSRPTAPTPVSPRPAVTVVVFTDSVTGFSTSDVRDAQEEIVRFNTAGELIWAADDTRFKEHPDRGPFLGSQAPFEVRFGAKDGERRAYLTFSCDVYHYCPPAIVVDLEVVNGQLRISDAKAPVPLPGG